MEQLQSCGFERDEQFGFETIWQGIELIISYCPRWLCSDGDEMITQHIEIRSIGKTALPITETGYRSCFLMGVDVLEEYQNDPVQYVLAWLNDAAQSKDWKEHLDRSRQGDLFS
jgi:hypothetical protein